MQQNWGLLCIVYRYSDIYVCLMVAVHSPMHIHTYADMEALSLEQCHVRYPISQRIE